MSNPDSNSQPGFYSGPAVSLYPEPPIANRGQTPGTAGATAVQGHPAAIVNRAVRISAERSVDFYTGLKVAEREADPKASERFARIIGNRAAALAKEYPNRSWSQVWFEARQQVEATEIDLFKNRASVPAGSLDGSPLEWIDQLVKLGWPWTRAVQLAQGGFTAEGAKLVRREADQLMRTSKSLNLPDALERALGMLEKQ